MRRTLSAMGTAALSWLVAGAVSAAPVLGTADAGTVSGLDEAANGERGGAGIPSTTVRTLDRALTPSASTGNKNLDLLLELPAQPRAAGQASTARSAAASSAADELAPARVRDARRLAPRLLRDDLDPALRDGSVGSGVSLQRFDGLGTLQGDARAEPSVRRREWRDQYGGPGGRERDIAWSGAHDGDASALLRAPRDALQFLRDNRFWVLGVMGLLVVLGAAAKAYSRRI